MSGHGNRSAVWTHTPFSSYFISVRFVIRQRPGWAILTRCIRNRLAWSRFVSNSIHNTELQVRCRRFDNDVLVAFDKRHPSVRVSVRPTDSVEFDIDLEVRTISADERALQSRG